MLREPAAARSQELTVGTWFLCLDKLWRNLREPYALSWVSQPPHLFQKAENQPPLVLSCLTAFYRDINTWLFQSRMPSFYRVLVFYLCLKKLDYNEQGIFVFYREGKSSFKCVLERSIWEKRGWKPKGETGKRLRLHRCSWGTWSSKSLQHSGHWRGLKGDWSSRCGYF